jgi:hypothetical protein
MHVPYPAAFTTLAHRVRHWFILLCICLCDYMADAIASMKHLRMVMIMYVASQMTVSADCYGAGIIRAHGSAKRACCPRTNISLQMKYYYAVDEHQTTSTMYRWLSQYAHGTLDGISFVELHFIHDDQVCRAVIDLNNNVEVLTQTKLKRDSVSLEYLYTIAEKNVLSAW